MKLNLLKTLLLTCLLGVWGADVHAAEVYSFTVSSSNKPDDFSTNASSETNQFTLDGVTWSIVPTTSTSSHYWAWEAAGIHMGSGNYYYQTCTVSTSGLSTYTINRIVVDAHMQNASANVTLSVTVGGQSFTCNGSESVSLTNNAAEYEFEYTSGTTGEIVITYSQPSTHYAFYLSGVTAYDADTHTDAELAYNEDYLGCYVGEVGTKAVVFPYLTYVDGFDGLSEITYSSSDTSVATVADDGTVTLTGTAGTSTITATFDGNDTYAAGHATYDIRVKAGTIYTFDFDLYTYGMTVFDSGSNYEPDVTEITGKNGSIMSFTQGDHYRIWKATGGTELRVMSGYSFTLSAPSGGYITEIAITGNSNVGSFSVSEGSYNTSSHVWTGEATSVKFTSTLSSGNHQLSTFLITLKTGTFTIQEPTYATFYTEDGFIMPEGVKGTTITGKESETGADGGYILDMDWAYTAGEIVPPSTAILLQGDAGDYEYVITSSGTAPENNLLHGSTTDNTTTNVNGETTGYLFYKLTYGSETGYENIFGFYWGAAEGAAFSSPANKAWLAVDATNATNIKFFSLEGKGEGDTTGITEVGIDSKMNDGVIYDIAGRRVSTPAKGGVYIMNGKKFIVK